MGLYCLYCVCVLSTAYHARLRFEAGNGIVESKESAAIGLVSRSNSAWAKREESVEQAIRMADSRQFSKTGTYFFVNVVISLKSENKYRKKALNLQGYSRNKVFIKIKGNEKTERFDGCNGCRSTRFMRWYR